MPLNLFSIPKGYPVSWCYAPGTKKDIPNCDVEGCQETPKFEVYPDAPDIPGISNVWFYLCTSHRDYLKKNAEDIAGIMNELVNSIEEENLAVKADQAI